MKQTVSLAGLPPFDTFKPCSYLNKEIDEITFVVKDTTTVTGWLGPVCLQPINSTKGWLVGFELVGAKQLRGNEESNSMPRMLWRAWNFDRQLKRADLTISKSELHLVYLKAAALLAIHPGAWRLK